MIAKEERMEKSWEKPCRSIAAWAAAALLCGSASEARAGRPIELRTPLDGPIQETIDLENFGLHPRWTAPLRILNRSDESLRSYAVFRLSQVVAPAAQASPERRAAAKPEFRMRLPKVREENAAPAAEVAQVKRDESGSTPPIFRRAGLDIRDRDPSERPSLLQPTVGPWLGDAELVPIQAPIDPPIQPQAIPPQVIAPPVSPALPAPASPNAEPEIPTTPATTEFPKPELFPNADSPNSVFPIPWETSAGSGVSPAGVVRPQAEPEPEEPPPPPNELPLRPATSSWDLAELEGPLFGTEQIAEFTREINAAGTWSVRPHFSTTALYDGNVFLSEDGQDSDFIITASPGVTARIGNDQTALYLLADYTLGAVFFTENSDENSLNHNGKLQLDWRGSRSSVGFRLGVENDSGTSIDATDRVRRTSYSAGLETRFNYSDKVSFDLNGDYRRSYYEDLIGSQDYGAQAYVNYHFTPKVTLGLGSGFAIAEVESGRTQHSQNVSLRANWVATPKLTLEGTLGVGFYQFENDDGDASEPDSVSPVASLRATYVATQKLTFSGDVGVGVTRYDSGGGSLSPTFNLDATWAVWDGTNVTFNGHRRVFNSVIFTDQNYTATGFTVGLTQQLGIRFVGFVTLGYENLEYTSEGRNVQADRQDDYFFARFGLQWHAFDRLHFGVFYEFSQNSSQGKDARDFRRDRTGLQMSVVF